MLYELVQFISWSLLVILIRAYVIPPKQIRRKKHRAVVVVGGDFARSPRMQYHAVSLSDCGLYSEVVCVGMHFKNQCCEDIRLRLAAGEPSKLEPKDKEQERIASRCAPITLSLLDQSGGGRPQGNWVVRTVKRVFGFVTGFGSLIWNSIESSKSISGDDDKDVSLVLVQTPPAVPFVPLIKALIFLQRCKRLFVSIGSKSSTKVVPKLVVDWHNFGFTLLAIDKRPAIIVAIYKFFERYFCEGTHNLTVSHAMKSVLLGASLDPNARKHGFKIPADSVTVLPDTAPAFFGPCSREEFLQEVIDSGKELEPPKAFLDDNEEDKTKSSNKGASRKCLTLVSATSWTADDDYTILVDALKKIEPVAKKKGMHVWAVVTGKGESRARFESQINEAGYDPKVITVTTVYIQSFRNYARMLGAADIGLSLHQSSSGWDLPMKVVDMFGCGLPVAATNYPALKELVTDGKHGWLFQTSTQLGDILESILTDLQKTGGVKEIEPKRKSVLEERGMKWNETWKKTAVPVLRHLLLAEEIAAMPHADPEYAYVRYEEQVEVDGGAAGELLKKKHQ